MNKPRSLLIRTLWLYDGVVRITINGKAVSNKNIVVLMSNEVLNLLQDIIKLQCPAQ